MWSIYYYLEQRTRFIICRWDFYHFHKFTPQINLHDKWDYDKPELNKFELSGPNINHINFFYPKNTLQKQIKILTQQYGQVEQLKKMVRSENTSTEDEQYLKVTFFGNWKRNWGKTWQNLRAASSFSWSSMVETSNCTQIPSPHPSTHTSFKVMSENSR